MHGATKLELDAYRDVGLIPSGFLSAVLQNDLFAAWDCADALSWTDLKNVIYYIQEKLPNGSYGSREKVAAWLVHSGMKGFEQRESA